LQICCFEDGATKTVDSNHSFCLKRTACTYPLESFFRGATTFGTITPGRMTLSIKALMLGRTLK